MLLNWYSGVFAYRLISEHLNISSRLYKPSSRRFVDLCRQTKRRESLATGWASRRRMGLHWSEPLANDTKSIRSYSLRSLFFDAMSCIASAISTGCSSRCSRPWLGDLTARRPTWALDDL